MDSQLRTVNPGDTPNPRTVEITFSAPDQNIPYTSRPATAGAR